MLITLPKGETTANTARPSVRQSLVTSRENFLDKRPEGIGLKFDDELSNARNRFKSDLLNNNKIFVSESHHIGTKRPKMNSVLAGRASKRRLETEP